jgi:hypothetical protein
VEIVHVDSKALTTDFVELPYSVYAKSPHFVPQLRADEYKKITPAKNPFYEHAQIAMWLAKRDGRTTGRVAAIHDDLHDKTHNERVTWFGFFEAEDRETTAALLAKVEAQGRAWQSTCVRGPANPSLNESAGLLVDAFDQDPVLLMPYNPPEYGAYIEAAGYAKVKDLLAWQVDVTEANERIQKVADRALRRNGITIRTVDMKRFDAELALMTKIYREAWVDNWGFVPPTDAEVRHTAHDLKPIIDPRMVIFAEMNGKTVGVAVTVPDANQVLKKMNGRLLPFGIFHFLRKKSIIDGLRLILLGVIPEARNVGLYPLLIAQSHHNAVLGGYRVAELSWTLEDNVQINAGIEATGGRRYKTYRVYEKSLG